jgi:hypothetical protein
MSIGSIGQSAQASALWAYQNQQQDGTTGAVGNGPPPPGNALGLQQGSGGADPFQQLASDLQSILVSLQNGGSSTATGATSNSSSSLTSQLANDIQAVMQQLQSQNAAGTTSDASAGQTASLVTANTGSTGTASAASGHHHHHHGGGEEATGSASDTASSAANTLASAIVQALQAYGSGDSAKAGSSTATVSLAA